ncbi:MFS transporter [Roseburia sp. 499]|uniref:MFS transporter n=1 Tax=Roseburia sp. 499 TaxID=1261634 RepID=UPI000951408E|nr:MFS transporter [Roseburia sp. 499]WVK68662.1 MFS transporter [Roseburia sp. 499]
MSEKKIRYRDLVTQKEYLKMIVANLINRFGDSVDALAFTWMVYAITGSAAWSAIIFGLNHIPTIFIQPFAGALVEGMKKKRLMIVTDIMRGIIVAGLAVLYGMDRITPTVLVVFTLVISTVEAFRIPAGMAFVPKILEEKYFEVGTGLGNTLSTVMELVGTGAAGGIIAVFGIRTAIFIDAVTFFLSALIISGIRYKEQRLQKQKVDVNGYFQLLKGGISYIKKKRIVMNFCIMGFLLNALLTPLNSLLTPLVVEVLKQDSEFLSVIGIALSVGMGIGSFCYPFLTQKIKSNVMVYLSGIMIGVFYLSFPLAGRFADYIQLVLIICILGAAGLGISASILMAVLNVQFMKQVDQEYMARAGSVFNAIGTAAIPVISVLITPLVAVLNVKTVLVVCGVLSMVLFICMGIGKVKFAEE